MKIITTIICCLIAFIATAQWTTDTDVNTLVVDAEAGDMQAIGTSDGKTYVVFWESVPAPTYYELRLQVLDANGNQTLGSNGMLVSDQISMSSYTVIWKIFTDGEDNIYIGATGTGGGDPAYVFKLDSQGNHLWGTSGVNVGNGNVVTVLPMEDGGAVVSWMGDAGGLMQRFDENGAAVWPNDISIVQGSSATVPANLFELSDGNYIVVFHSILFGINSNLYAQRYDGDGNAVWPQPTQVASGLTAFNRSYTGLQDEDVVYMGYFLADNNRFDSYLQRINSDGSLPWGINGADFAVGQADLEMETEIAFEPGTQYVWSIVTYADSNQNFKGEYVQKFDKASGEGLLTVNAKSIYPIGSEKIHAGSLMLRDGSPLFLMQDGLDTGASPITLHAVYLDENGDFVWPEETYPVATFQANKGRIQFTREGNNQNVAVFIENKGEGDRIYAQNILFETVGIEDVSQIVLRFANPVADELNITSNTPIQTISIFNSLGQEIFHSKYMGESNVKENTRNWTQGVYFMNISTDQGLKKGLKFIKH